MSNNIKLLLLLLLVLTSCKHKQTQISYHPSAVNQSRVRVIYKHSNGTMLEESEITAWIRDLSLIAQLKVKGKPLKEVTLNEGYIPIIPLFIRELKSIPNDKTCLMTDSYTVYIDTQIIHKVDRTCNWNGFSQLKSALFDN